MKPPPHDALPAADDLNRRGALVLLAALSVAIGTGLLACGPISRRAPLSPTVLSPAATISQDVLILIGCVALLLAGAHGCRALRTAAGMPPTLRSTWRWFFLSVAALGLSAGLRVVVDSALSIGLAELCGAAATVMLFIGLMADRVTPLLGGVPMRLAGLTAAAVATVWWACGSAQLGCGDVRGLLFVEALPLAALASGFAGLPSCSTRPRGLPMLSAAFGLARLLSLADGSLLPDLGALSHPDAAPLAVAAAAAWWAHRLAAAPQSAGHPAEGAPAHRSTSLNTSG